MGDACLLQAEQVALLGVPPPTLSAADVPVRGSPPRQTSPKSSAGLTDSPESRSSSSMSSDGASAGAGAIDDGADDADDDDADLPAAMRAYIDFKESHPFSQNDHLLNPEQIVAIQAIRIEYPGKALIFIDTREKDGLVQAVRLSMGRHGDDVRIVSMALHVGDVWVVPPYATSHDGAPAHETARMPWLVYERKTWSDLIGSITSDAHRAHSQVDKMIFYRAMRAAFPRMPELQFAYVIECGDRVPKVGGVSRGMNNCAVYGYLWRAVVRDGVPQYTLGGIEDTASMLSSMVSAMLNRRLVAADNDDRLLRFMNRNADSKPIKAERQSMSGFGQSTAGSADTERMVALMLAQVPGVTLETGKLLASTCGGTLDGLCQFLRKNQPYEESYDGAGRKRKKPKTVDPLADLHLGGKRLGPAIARKLHCLISSEER